MLACTRLALHKGKEMSEKEKLDEAQRRVAACLNAFDGIPTDKIEGKNLGEILAGEMRLNNAGPRADGGFGFEFSGGVCQLMAEAFAEQFKQSGAINYLELLFDHSDIGPLTITMQRVDGLTPAHKLAKAESERDALQQKLDAVLAENYSMMALAIACEKEFGSYTAKEFPDEEKVSYPEERCHITFGMIRQAINKSATDALLNEVRAEGIDICISAADTCMSAGAYWPPLGSMREIARSLRAETDTTSSQYESLAGGK